MLFPAILIAYLLVYTQGISEDLLIEEQWEQFKLEHNKIYATEDEDRFRIKVFIDNMHTILEHNKLYEMGATTYTMGINQFGDLTDDEFIRIYSIPYNSETDENYDELPQENFITEAPTYLYSNKPLPETVDWRKEGAVTEVKEQGECGSCYAFTATGALEAQHFFKTKKLVSLSEQNILDCTYKRKKYRNNGCRGGRVDKSFEYIMYNKGINTEPSYPYTAIRSKCKFLAESVGARMSSYKKVPSGNETELQKAVAWVGPIAVMVDSRNMKFYQDGIYDNPSCSSKEFTHSMLAIGYGSFFSQNYWILKNSLGASWGNKGYMAMVRNKENMCAIATAAIYPII